MGHLNGDIFGLLTLTFVYCTMTFSLVTHMGRRVEVFDLGHDLRGHHYIKQGNESFLGVHSLRCLRFFSFYGSREAPSPWGAGEETQRGFGYYILLSCFELSCKGGGIGGRVVHFAGCLSCSCASLALRRFGGGTPPYHFRST